MARTGRPLIGPWLSGYQRIFDYKGRTQRIDFWEFVIANSLLWMTAIIIYGQVQKNQIPGVSETIGLLIVALLLVSFAASLPLVIRRLRDSGDSILWVLLPFVPLVNAISSPWLFYLFAKESATKKDVSGDSNAAHGMYTCLSLSGIVVNWFIYLSFAIRGDFSLDRFIVLFATIVGVISSYALLCRNKSGLLVARLQLSFVIGLWLIATISNPGSLRGMLVNALFLVPLAVALFLWTRGASKKYACVDPIEGPASFLRSSVISAFVAFFLAVLLGAVGNYWALEKTYTPKQQADISEVTATLKGWMNAKSELLSGKAKPEKMIQFGAQELADQAEQQLASDNALGIRRDVKFSEPALKFKFISEYNAQATARFSVTEEVFDRNGNLVKREGPKQQTETFYFHRSRGKWYLMHTGNRQPSIGESRTLPSKK